MNKYLKEAKEYYEISLNEIKEAQNNGKIELAVDGCDKGWLAVVLATNALFVKNGVERLPRVERGRRYLLVKYGTRDLRKIYHNTRDILHIEGFYERSINYDEIFECLEDIKSYIEEIEKI